MSTTFNNFAFRSHQIRVILLNNRDEDKYLGIVVVSIQFLLSWKFYVWTQIDNVNSMAGYLYFYVARSADLTLISSRPGQLAKL